MPPLIVSTEYLEINSVPLATPAWDVVDYSPLYDEKPVRHANRIIPNVTGRAGYMPVGDEKRVMLRMVIKGERNHENTVYANPRVGLWTNIAYLRTNVVAPTGTGDGTRAATWHLPDGTTTKTANVQVIPPLSLSELGLYAVRAVLEFIIPAGDFA